MARSISSRCFNPTLVRLRRPAPLDLLAAEAGFNPTLVRLRRGEDSLEREIIRVSIPRWFD